MGAKKLFSGIKKFFTDKSLRIGFLAKHGFYDHMPDEKFLKKQFKATMGKELDLENPQTLNEKLQWLKLYNRKPEYTMMVDKYLVKDYIAKELGEQYVVPLIGVWDDPDDIDFDKLPNQFVLKCNHNSAVGLCVCRDKSKLDIEKTRKALKKGLKQDCYMAGREWPYKNVPRKVICEKYITDSPDSDQLTDYKFFCFNGKVDCVMVALDRATGDTKFYFFDQDWNLLRYNIRGREAPEGFTIPMPKTMPKMFSIASKLSKGLPFARIDLYSCEDQVYFGEITFFPASGFDDKLLAEPDLHWGQMIDLPTAQK